MRTFFGSVLVFTLTACEPAVVTVPSRPPVSTRFVQVDAPYVAGPGTPVEARDCRRLCAPEKLGAATEQQCLRRTHYRVYATWRAFLENSFLRRAGAEHRCLLDIEEAMSAANMAAPSYACQVLERRDSKTVTLQEWLKECDEDVVDRWCTVDLAANYYGFIRPYFLGSGCPRLPPLRR